MFRKDFYTGGEHYWIGFYNGTCAVMREDYEENEIVFKEHYEECVECINNIIADNVDYDLNL